MATGLPIVASDIPPHEEVIADAGILVLPRNTEKLAEALNILIRNPSLRETLGQKAKKRSKIFSIGNMVKSYEDLFEKTLKKKGVL